MASFQILREMGEGDVCVLPLSADVERLTETRVSGSLFGDLIIFVVFPWVFGGGLALEQIARSPSSGRD